MILYGLFTYLTLTLMILVLRTRDNVKSRVVWINDLNLASCLCEDP